MVNREKFEATKAWYENGRFCILLRDKRDPIPILPHFVN